VRRLLLLAPLPSKRGGNLTANRGGFFPSLLAQTARETGWAADGDAPLTPAKGVDQARGHAAAKNLRPAERRRLAYWVARHIARGHWLVPAAGCTRRYEMPQGGEARRVAQPGREEKGTGHGPPLVSLQHTHTRDQRGAAALQRETLQKGGPLNGLSDGRARMTRVRLLGDHVISSWQGAPCLASRAGREATVEGGGEAVGKGDKYDVLIPLGKPFPLVHHHSPYTPLTTVD
jgi:hypothetical protein